MTVYETPWGERELPDEEAKSLRGQGFTLTPAKNSKPEAENPPAPAKTVREEK